MDPLTVVIAKLVRRHPLGAPYVLIWSLIVCILGFHPW